MPVSGGTGLIQNVAGGSWKWGEMRANPAAEYGTARPGPASVSGPGLYVRRELAHPLSRVRYRRFATALTCPRVPPGADVLSRNGGETLL